MREMECVQYESTSQIQPEPCFDCESSEGQSKSDTHRQEGVDNVSFNRAQRFVSDHHEDLLLFLQADEIPKPRFLS